MQVDNTHDRRRPPSTLRSPFTAGDTQLSGTGTPDAISISGASSISVPGHQPHVFRPSPHSGVNGTQSPFQTGTLSPFKSIGMSPSSAVTPMSPSIFPPSPGTATGANNTNSTNNTLPFDPMQYSKIPDSIPHLTPSYPAALFGGICSDDEHVTVWEPATGKTVAGNAAPYRRNLVQWLQSHVGWEEKADELKSSKRRAAARRSKTAAVNFAALCAFPISKCIATDALRRFKEAGVRNPDKSLSNWSPEDYVRLQEILFRVAQEVYTKHGPTYTNNTNVELPVDCWDRVAQHIGGSNKKATDIVYLAHHMLEFGIQKSGFELDASLNGKHNNNSSNINGTSPGGVRAIGIPGRGNNGNGSRSGDVSAPGSYDSGWRAPGSFGALSLPNMGSEGLSAITNSFRTPKEPRITVWHPATGKTISGNAAPCRRNLETWMKQHPGWQPKAETQLSSARRSRAKKNSNNNNNSSSNARPMSVPTSAIAINTGTRNSYGNGQYRYNHQHMSHLSGNSHSLEGSSPQLEAAHGLLGLSTSIGSCNSTNGLLVKIGSAGNKKQMSSVSSSGADDVEDEGDSTEDEDEMEM